MEFNMSNRMKTSDISKQVGLGHIKFIIPIRKHFDLLKQHGFIEKHVEKQKRGGWMQEYYVLDENVLSHLILLMSNSEPVLKFKSFVINELNKNKDLIENERKQIREEGKVDRRFETDTIKEFIQRAKEQGSKNSHQYYMLLTKMTYDSLFTKLMTIECDNFRELLNSFSLTNLQQAERIISATMKECLKDPKLHYREIFQICKEKVMQYATLIGKLPADTATDKSLSLRQLYDKAVQLRISKK